MMLQMKDEDGNLVPVRGLLDTGTSETMVLNKFVKKGSSKSFKGKPVQWKTMGGMFTTNQKRLLDVSFPELHPHKTVSWICHADSTTKSEDALCDVTTGMDMMTETGIFVNTADKVIQWEDNTAPLHPRGTLSNASVMNTLCSPSMEADVLKDAESRQRRIIKASYDRIDMNKHVKEISTLSQEQKSPLASKSSNFDTSFGGGLGTLNTPPAHTELREDAKLKKRRPFPIPQSQCQLMKDEANRLKDIGVLEWVDTKQPGTGDPDFASPSFPQPKKDTNQMRFLTGFEELNKHIIRRPFPLPKISDMLQKL